MSTITWTINNLERKASDGLVTVVHWGACATDGDYTASIVNTLPLDRGDSFTAFEQLSESQVLGWVQAAVGKDTVEAALEQMIDEQKHPKTLAGLPWSE